MEQELVIVQVLIRLGTHISEPIMIHIPARRLGLPAKGPFADSGKFCLPVHAFVDNLTNWLIKCP
jgi:hypothetical protein